jgi:hypothetical protein
MAARWFASHFPGFPHEDDTIRQFTPPGPPTERHGAKTSLKTEILNHL